MSEQAGAFRCPNGGPHYFKGGGSCVCGAKQGYALIANSHLEAMNVREAALTAERDRLFAGIMYVLGDHHHGADDPTGCHEHLTRVLEASSE
jgi:hypothetical protein